MLQAELYLPRDDCGRLSGCWSGLRAPLPSTAGSSRGGYGQPRHAQGQRTHKHIPGKRGRQTRRYGTMVRSNRFASPCGFPFSDPLLSLNRSGQQNAFSSSLRGDRNQLPPGGDLETAVFVFIRNIPALTLMENIPRVGKCMKPRADVFSIPAGMPLINFWAACDASPVQRSSCVCIFNLGGKRDDSWVARQLHEGASVACLTRLARDTVSHACC